MTGPLLTVMECPEKENRFSFFSPSFSTGSPESRFSVEEGGPKKIAY